jgi:hypothetical protein
MKIVHDTYAHGELVEFRPVIWKSLLQNSRSIVMAIQSRNLGPIRRSNKVSLRILHFSPLVVNAANHKGKLRVHNESPN